MTIVSASVQNRSTCGSSSVNGATPRIETQITGLRPMRSPTGPPTSVPTADANRKRNRCICALCTERPNLLDQVERVEAADARDVEVLREDQHQQHGDRASTLRARQRRRSRPRSRRAPAPPRGARAYQRLTCSSSTMPSSAASAEPRDAALAERHDHRRRDQRPERAAGVAADLEQRLRQAVLAARGQARDARRLGVEDRRAGADQRRGQQHASRSSARHASSSRPHSVKPMPTGSEYGRGRRSV